MDRDPRPDKRERPRDELGRPLPWGSENRLVLEDYEHLDIAKNLRLGVEHFNAGRFFPAHEAWEAAWRQARGTADEEFFQGLAQLGAGYTHYRRRNAHGARVLLERALAKLQPYGPSHNGLDLAQLLPRVAADSRLFEACEREGRPLPAIAVPRL